MSSMRSLVGSTLYSPIHTEDRRVASTEARRLKRIPPQNAEHGVVRNYVRPGAVFSSLFSCFT